MNFFAVFTVSFSTLFFEVLVNRSFAITQWSHLAFMVIGVALFGISAGSVWVHVRMIKRPGKAIPVSIGVLSLTTGVCIVASWVLLNLVPFDSIRLPVSTAQIGYLVAVFSLLALPFFFSGAVSAAGFASEPRRPGGVYAAAMIGSAAGAALPVFLLPSLGFGGCIVLAAAVPVLPVYASGGVKYPAAATTVIAAAATLLFFPSILQPQPSSYKELQRYLQHPGAEVTSREDTISARVETYSGTGFRSAPGLTLGYTGELPLQTGVFVDSGSPTALYAGSRPADFDFALKCVGAAAYALIPAPAEVLVHLEDGGSAIAAAIASGAPHITVLDQIDRRAAVLRRHYADFDVTVLSGPARTNLTGLQTPFDIIVIDHLGTSAPGLISTNEDFVLTVESVSALLGKLAPGGILSISRRLQLPPSDSLKAFATAYTALKDIGTDDPAAGMCMIRTFNIYTLLLSPDPFDTGDSAALRSFAETGGFDLVFLQGMSAAEANRFSRREEALYYNEIARIYQDLESGVDEYSSAYLLNIAPATDDKPYFNRFIKWSRITALFEATGRRSQAFYFTGEVLIVWVLLISIVLSFAIVMTPALVMAVKKRRVRVPPAAAFMFVGAGFMLFELAWLKRLPPIIGAQTTTFAAVITGLLITSGLGGWLSERLDTRKLPAVAAAASFAVAASGGCMYLLLPRISGLGPLVAPVVALAPAALPGLLMGMLLPMIMRGMCRSDTERVFGWAANGTLSVLASTAAAGLALFSGIQSLLWIAAALYAITAVIAAVGATRR